MRRKYDKKVDNVLNKNVGLEYSIFFIFFGGGAEGAGGNIRLGLFGRSKGD